MWTNQQREILLLRYLSALEDGQPETIAEILTQAETDPMLERMIRDLHTHLEPHEQAVPAPKYPAPNGHYPSVRLGNGALPQAVVTSEQQRKETQPMTTLALERPRYDLPWTLITTALLVVVVSGVALFSLGLDLPTLPTDSSPSANMTAALQPTDGAGAAIATGDECTLADAIHAANSDSAVGACPAGEGDDTITLTGDVLLTEIDNDSELTGANGLPVITSTITIEGDGFTVERAEDAPPFRIFMVDDAGTLTLNNIIVSGGDLTYGDEWRLDETAEFIGGGVLNYGATLTISNSTFSSNAATDGGAIYSDGITTIIENTVLSGNAAANGGGVYSVSGTLIVSNDTFSGNSAADGGGLYNGSGDATITNSVFSGNDAATGGGINNDSGVLTITNGTFSGNNAATGAGIYNHGGVVDLASSTFSGNNAANGAGLYNHGGVVTVSDSTFAGNEAMDGAGLVNHEGTLTVQNSVFTGNIAMTDADIQGEAEVSGNTFTGSTTWGDLDDFNVEFSFDFPMFYQECILAAGEDALEGFGEEGFEFEVPEDFPEECLEILVHEFEFPGHLGEGFHFDFGFEFPEECAEDFPETIWEDGAFHWPEEISEECLEALPEPFPELIWEGFPFEFAEQCVFALPGMPHEAIPEGCLELLPEGLLHDVLPEFEWLFPDGLPEECAGLVPGMPAEAIPEECLDLLPEGLPYGVFPGFEFWFQEDLHDQCADVVPEVFHFDLQDDFPEVCIEVIVNSAIMPGIEIVIPEECNDVLPEDFPFEHSEDFPPVCIGVYIDNLMEYFWQDFDDAHEDHNQDD